MLRGDQLVVSEKGANTIATYPLTAGAAPEPVPPTPRPGQRRSASRSESATRSNVTEAGASALTSDQLDPFAPITPSLLNGQGAACWAASTRDGRFTFTANAATDSILAYSQNWKGELSLVTPGGATAQLAAGTHPLDEIVSRDRFLYVNGGNTGQINAFKIGRDGSLMPLGAFGALPAGFGGLVASS